MALQVAAGAEHSATRFYAKLAEITRDPELKALYSEFVEFETGHSDWLEKKLAEARRTSGGAKLA
jgi:rubrerythrin